MNGLLITEVNPSRPSVRHVRPSVGPAVTQPSRNYAHCISARRRPRSPGLLTIFRNLMNLDGGRLFCRDGNAEERDFATPPKLAHMDDAMKALVMGREHLPLQRVSDRSHLRPIFLFLFF